jgi:hypothetical protein
MKRSQRVLLLGLFVMILLLGGGYWLASNAAAGNIGSGGPNPEAAKRIFEVMGMAGVPFAMLFAALYFSLKRKGE